MIANYGYQDGSGFYYITIDGDICAKCNEYGCVGACPFGVYEIEMDDYDDVVAVIAEKARKRLRELCAGCKSKNGGSSSERVLPCMAACPEGSIRHSW